MARKILVKDDDTLREFGYVLVCSGYLVERSKVLLVHHNRFDKWVPPGGHIEPGETFAEAAAREFKEETGLVVEAISTQPIIHPADGNSSPEPVPFYSDVEREGFAVPAITQFFYMQRAAGTGDSRVQAQLSEVHDAAWFSIEELDTLRTFEQVRSLARYALLHYPSREHRA
ncbi:NUDIX hydrolase [Nocardiopsis alba]|uniref:NUDIX hydrolase n=1 Tax=Nocardiopsis alba TaxID=53437 RepID=UPI0035E150F7